MGNPGLTRAERTRHWDAAYASHGVRGVSWYQDAPSVSLELIGALDVSREAAVIDVGGGASSLAANLVERGFVDVAVLDLSTTALNEVRARMGDASPVNWLHEDVLEWHPERRYVLWRDRAVFHFLLTRDDRQKYLRALQSAIQPGGFVIVATFAADGPEFCSGLPVSHYSGEELTDLLGVGFELQQTRQEEHITPKGVRQPFTWVAGRIRSV